MSPDRLLPRRIRRSRWSRTDRRPIFVSSDNALGSPSGDVDDAFAIAALLASGAKIVASTYGNTSEARAFENNTALAKACGVDVELLHGAAAPLASLPFTSSEAAKPSSRDALAAHEGRVAALGPLTDVAAALAIGPCKWSEVVILGGDLSSWGRFPPLWPMEFNLTADRRATRAVFSAEVPLTLVPLDVARRLSISAEDLAPIRGPLGEHLRSGSRRWFRRTRIRKLSSCFAVWDLVAAMWLIEPSLFQAREILAHATRIGRVAWNRGRKVRVITAFDRGAVWSKFLAVIGAGLAR